MTQVSQLYQVFRQHRDVSTDTRKITKGCIFFALKGPNFNANQFAEKALHEGAAFAVIDDPVFAKGEKILLVDDVLITLQQLSSYHRSQFTIPVIAIAGSNGKTTTKELITSVLSKKFRVLSTSGNFNNHIGVPLTLLMLDAVHEIAVIEIGANHEKENAFLCDLIKPGFGLVTNNGKDHLEGFGSLEGVARSNAEVFEFLQYHAGVAFVNALDHELMIASSKVKTRITYAAESVESINTADVMGNAKTVRPQIHFSLPDEQDEIVSALSGEYNFDNIMAAVCIGKHFHVDFHSIKLGIEEYTPDNKRSQVIKKAKNTLYLDAYNANPTSMELSLKNFASMPFGNKIAILGDMLEMGSYAESEHKNLMNLCRVLPLEKVIYIGKEFTKQALEGDICLQNTEDAISFVKELQLAGKNVFLKGSRSIKLEEIAAVIE